MYQIGVDIGGTNIKIGLIDEHLEIAARTSIKFPHGSAEDVTAAMAVAIREVLAGAGVAASELESIGLIVPGSIDRTGARVIDAYNLGFHDVPLKALMEAQFSGIPVRIANDADGAAVAELYRGAFIGCQTAVLLTLGTGLGGGIILNGRLFSGGMRNGVELGHAYLVDGGESCTCGNCGCMEAYCAATALARDGARAMAEHPHSLIAEKAAGKPENVDAKLVIDCAKAGDQTANAVFAVYVGHLGSTCASVFNILDPEVIAIGGGVCGAGEFLFAPLRENVESKCFYKTHGKVVPAVLGNDAGMIGAAMLKRNAER